MWVGVCGCACVCIVYCTCVTSINATNHLLLDTTATCLLILYQCLEQQLPKLLTGPVLMANFDCPISLFFIKSLLGL